MNVTEYEYACSLTKCLDQLEASEVKPYLAIGLAGEVGEVLNLLKKQQYYNDYHLDYDLLKEELGDCLYYLTNLITDCGFSLDDVMESNAKKVHEVLARKLVAE